MDSSVHEMGKHVVFSDTLQFKVSLCPRSAGNVTGVELQGVLPRRPIGPGGLFAPNENRQNATKKSGEITDEQIMEFLESCGLVNPKELCTYVTPQDLQNQTASIDPITQAINAIINAMARTRRLILYRKLTKTGNPDDVARMKLKLTRWPVQVQEMQGRIEELKGRCLQIHPFLVTDLDH